MKQLPPFCTPERWSRLLDAARAADTACTFGTSTRPPSELLAPKKETR